MVTLLSEKASLSIPIDEDKIPHFLKCEACSKPSINCFQTRHGCRLCQACVVSWQKDFERSKLCPCGIEVCIHFSDQSLISRANCYPDFATRRDINALEVWCPNTGKGCRHHCKWLNVDAHLNESCEFEVRKCELCHKEVVQCLLNSTHKNLLSESCCAEFSAPCPHCKSSKLMFNRQSFQEHLESPCPCRPVKCKYSYLGCHVTATSEEMVDHYRNSSDGHMELMENYHKHKTETTVECMKKQLEKRLKALEDQVNGTRVIEMNHVQTQTKRGINSTGCDAALPDISTSSEGCDNESASQKKCINEQSDDHQTSSGSQNSSNNAVVAAMQMFSDGLDCEAILTETFERNPELLSTRNAAGDNHLMAALRNQLSGRAEKLLDLAARVNATIISDRSQNQDTLLMLIASQRDEEAAARMSHRILELDPPQLHQCNNDGCNVLHICARRNLPLVLGELLHCAQRFLQVGRLEAAPLVTAVNLNDRWGNSPISLAATSKNSKMKQRLISFCHEIYFCFDIHNCLTNSHPSSSGGSVFVPEQPTPPAEATGELSVTDCVPGSSEQTVDTGTNSSSNLATAEHQAPSHNGTKSMRGHRGKSHEPQATIRQFSSPKTTSCTAAKLSWQKGSETTETSLSPFHWGLYRHSFHQ